MYHTVTLLEDPSCEMAEVQVDGVRLFHGNFWDFHPGCHDLSDDPVLKDLPEEWQGCDELYRLTAKILTQRGAFVIQQRQAYTYQD